MSPRHSVAYYAARHAIHRLRERWPGVKHRIGRLGHALWKFLGPVAGSVHNKLSEADTQRVAIKSIGALVTTGLSGAALHAMAVDPEVMATVILPVVSTAVFAVCMTAMHMLGGVQPDEPTQPPEETKPDA